MALIKKALPFKKSELNDVLIEVKTYDLCTWIKRINSQIIKMENQIQGLEPQPQPTPTSGNTTYVYKNTIPSPETGNVGDIAIVLDTGDFYQKTEANWDLLGSISVDGGNFA